MAASDSPFKAAVRFCFKTLPAEFLAIFYRRDVCLISRVVDMCHICQMFVSYPE